MDPFFILDTPIAATISAMILKNQNDFYLVFQLYLKTLHYFEKNEIANFNDRYQTASNAKTKNPSETTYP